jgi:SulP family sulfate permease
LIWLFPSLHGYRRDWLRGDLLAGLTVWAVLVPEALAYASIAGVSPVVGLYAAPGALILYAALGSSRQLIAGPMSATAALSAATVAAIVPVGGDRFTAMTAALAITTGLAALLAGMLRLGFVASFISEPVIKGFIVGLALTIIIGQRYPSCSASRRAPATSSSNCGTSSAISGTHRARRCSSAPCRSL